jgi:hypothetical protein
MPSVDIASTIARPLSQHFKERMLPVESHSLRWLHRASVLRVDIARNHVDRSEKQHRRVPAFVRANLIWRKEATIR